MLKRILYLLVCTILTGQILNAQVTTSNISGIVKGQDGAALIGATVQVTHEPTKTVYTVTTRSGGRFDLANIQPGGPYTIEVSYSGMQTEKKTDIYLTLGDNNDVDFQLNSSQNQLQEVVISTTNRSIISRANGGAETNIGADKIANLPTVNRNLFDYLRFTPQATINGDGGVSIGGMNNRYNSLMIDGAVNNDVFGLSAQGTNGGQAGISPISIDAIEQISVAVSPFDVSQGNFTGGAINAVTRRGSNFFHGSAYYFFKNQDLAGKDPNPKNPHVKLKNFSSRTYGFRVGGPIIKNKLFFFVNGEIQRDKTPQFFGINQYQGTSKQTDLDNLRQYLIQNYKYDPGDYQNSPYKLNANKIVARIDWNASAKTKVSLSHRYSYGEAFNSGKLSSSNQRINFSNGGVYFPSTTNSTSLEVNSRFTNKTNNKLILGYTNVFDDRNPMGNPFPAVSISDGTGTINFGSEQFSTANQLKQKNLTLFDEFRLYKGKHNFSFGVDGELSKTYNLFIRQNFGLYNYKSLADFMNNAKPARYQRSYSLVDNKTGDGSAAAADFKVGRISFFAQDKVNFNSNFSLTYGVRIDHWDFITKPFLDTFFNNTAAPFLSQYYDLHGALSSQMPTKIWSVNPRIGFTYNVPAESITVRGGIGLFSGRVPLVWPGGMFTNSGVIVGGVDVNNPNIQFRGDYQNQFVASDFGLSNKVPSGEIDVVAKNFKLPQVMKILLGADKELPWGIKGTMELEYNKFLQAINYTRVDLIPPTQKSSGAGSRTIYTNGRFTTFNGIKNPYSSIYLLDNATGNKGFSYNFLLAFSKAMNRGWSANLSWSYGDSWALNDGLSSQNSSQWRFTPSVNGKNNLDLGRSTFAQGHRISAYVAKRIEEGKFGATTITLYYNGQQGQPFSYVYNRSMIGDDGLFSFDDLIYIPKNSSEIVFANSNGSISNASEAAAQWAALDTYISNDKYLSKHRGQFAGANEANAPWSHIVDLKLQQDFYLKVGSNRHMVTLSLDMFNFTNFLNRDWGRNYYVQFSTYSLMTFKGYRNAGAGDYTPLFNFTTPNGTPWTINDIPFYNASRWTSQLGLRYTF